MPPPVYINAGELRNRGKLQQNTPTQQDEAGALIDAWSDVRSVWAKIEPLTPKIAEFARTFAPTVSHQVTIRYTSSLADGMRLVFGNRVFEINGFVDVEERRIKHLLFCTELRGPSAPTP